MVLDLALYTEDPDGVGDALNIFLFIDHPPSVGSEASLLNHLWDAVLGDNTFTYFSDTGTILGRKKVAPVAIWDAASKHIKDWTVFCTVLLGDATDHLADQDM